MFQLVKVLFAVSALASIQGTVLRVNVATRAEDCSEYIFGECNLDVEGIIATFNTDNLEICQKYCAVVYSESCNGFYFNQVDQTCSLLHQTIEDHIGTCRMIGGTERPGVEDCLTQTDPCSLFHDEFCTFTSNVIEDFPGIQSAWICQEACKLNVNCFYFLYDIDVKRCQLLNGTQRKCSVTVGPASPSLEECRTTTTTSPSTTTETITSTTTETTTTTTETTTTTTETTTATTETTSTTTETTTTTSSKCTTPVYTKSDGKCACGFYLETELNWFEARDQCAAQGARLPEIYSQKENDDIVNLQPKDEYLWLGGTDLEKEGTFVWESSRTVFSFSNWADHQPDNYKGVEHCAHLLKDEKWNDNPCDKKLLSMCEVIFDC